MPLLSTGIITQVSDRQTHLLLRIFYEMNRGLRDTYFLPLVKSSLLWACWIKHGYQSCLLMACALTWVCQSLAKLFSKKEFFTVLRFCGHPCSISCANWLWLHKPAVFCSYITVYNFIFYWITIQSVLVFHQLSYSAIYVFWLLQELHE